MENKIDRRIKYVIVLDTETAPMDKDAQGVDPYNMLVYDVGFAVCDKHGNVYETFSFVNYDVYVCEKSLMKSAYYADKIPLYEKQIASGERKLVKFSTIRKVLNEVIQKYGITEIYAHNHRFDLGALNNTERWLTKSKYRYFYPRYVEIYDTLKMSRQILGKQKAYKEYCKLNSYMTKNNQPRFTAEIIYRYITGNKEFTEEHQGLQDVLIEKEILSYCVSRHKKMDGKLF